MNAVSCEALLPCGISTRKLITVLAIPLVVVAFVLLAPSDASAQTTYGDVTLVGAPLSGSTGSSPSTTLTWPHTIPDSANRILIVTVAIHRTGGTLATVTSITYTPTAGSPISLLANVQTQGESADGLKRTEIWGLVAPPIGTGDILLTVSSASNVVGASYSFSSVDQSAPVAFAGKNNAIDVADSDAQIGVTLPGFASGPNRHGVVDVLAIESSFSASPAAQLFPHDVATTASSDNLRGCGGAYDPPGLVSFFSPYFLSGNDFWQMSYVTLRPATLTGVGLESVDATAFAGARPDGRTGGVTVTWRTGLESNNLGYRVYRERDGVRTQVTNDLIAGSGLFTPQNLSSGYRYATYDPSGRPGDVYYLEDIEFSGNRNLHGPFTAGQTAGKSPVTADSPTLQDLNDRVSGSRLVFEDSPDIANAKGGGNAPGGANAQFQLANTPAIKIGVRETGWYRVTPATLAGAGLNLGSIDPRTLRLYNGGREVAIRVSGEADGRFDLGDAIEFYGTAVDVQSTDTNVYWLTTATGNGLRMKVQPKGPTTGAAIRFPAVAELKERFIYFASLENGERENYFGKVVTADPAVHNLTITNIDPAGPNAVVEVVVQGVTLVPHRVTVTLNGQEIGEIAFSERATGNIRVTVPQSMLVEGANVVSLATAAGADPADASLVDSIRIGYTHKATADQNLAIVNVSTRTGARTFDGFTNGQIRAFDVTNPSAVQELTGTVARTANGFGIAIQPGLSTRRLVVTTLDKALVPASIGVNRPSTWNATSNGANVVYITHRDFAASVAPLKALRESQGYRVAVVDVEDLYDEFSAGLESPAAIRGFVARARATWSVKPTFVTFVGDGTHDPKNYLGAGDFSFVPSKLIDASAVEMASDDWLVDGNGDDLPDVAVGRLPVRTAAEASAMIAKIVAFESAGTVNRSALLVSDVSDISDFSTTTSDIRDLLPPDYVVSEITRGLDTDAATRQSVLSGANSGPGIVNFVGHGAIDMWRGNLLNAADAGTLANAGRLSVYVSANCLNGYYQDPLLESLGEALLKSPNGAVAVWASSGATGPEGQRVMLDAFYRVLFSNPALSVGQAAAQAKATAAGDVRRSWVLLGDAATKLN